MGYLWKQFMLYKVCTFGMNIYVVARLCNCVSLFLYVRNESNILS